MIDIEQVAVTDLPSAPFGDFRDLPAEPGIYFVLGENDKILYIGQSSNLKSRFAGKHHQLAALRKNLARRIYWLTCAKDVALEVETAAIHFFSPLLNGKVEVENNDAHRFHLVIPNELFSRLTILAQKNNRTVTGQILSAIEWSIKETSHESIKPS